MSYGATIQIGVEVDTDEMVQYLRYSHEFTEQDIEDVLECDGTDFCDCPENVQECLKYYIESEYSQGNGCDILY